MSSSTPRRTITRRRAIQTLGAAAAGAALGCTAGRKGSTDEAAGRRPNILFLMTDQHRGDCLGCDGNALIQTPNLDGIAREGVRFSTAYTATPSCTPARAGLLTALSPWHHGMLGYGRVAPEYPFEYTTALREAGYYLHGIGKMHWHPQRNLHGFHETELDESGRRESKDFISDYHQWFEKQAPGLDPNATGIGWNDYRGRTYVLAERLHPTTWTGDRAVAFLKNYQRQEPFFLKVSFARPHSPYDPPQRFLDMYDEDRMPDPYVGDWAAPFAPHKDPPNAGLAWGDLGAQQARRSRRHYYGSVSFIDEQIGRILQTLRDRGLYENTLIVFTADHGDMLGDHHHWRKTYAYDGSARIPMLMRWPESMAPGADRGGVRREPVELRDLGPTFMDIAGARIPDGLDGASLLPLARGDARNWRPFIDLEHDRCYSRENQWNALTDGRRKYVWFSVSGEEQFFDLEQDPGETRDLANDPGRRAEVLEWRRRMVEHLSERGEEFVRDGELVQRDDRMLYSPNYPGQEG